jgi:hypothetical protein
VVRQSVQFFADFGDIPWMHHVRNGVTHDGIAFAVLNWEHHHFVLFEVIVRQGHRAVENLQDSSGFVFLRRSTWTVALQARSVSVGTEKFVSLAAVWFVTGATTLHKCGLVVDPLLCQIRDVRMTAQADFNGVRLRKSGILAGKGVVAIGAIADCPGMLHLCCVNLLGRVVVAGDAERLRVRLGQHDFPLFCRGVADFALFVCKGRMREARHQLGHSGLVRVVALNAIGGGERLVLVCLLQALVFHVVACLLDRGRPSNIVHPPQANSARRGDGVRR